MNLLSCDHRQRLAKLLLRAGQELVFGHRTSEHVASLGQRVRIAIAVVAYGGARTRIALAPWRARVLPANSAGARGGARDASAVGTVGVARAAERPSRAPNSSARLPGAPSVPPFPLAGRGIGGEAESEPLGSDSVRVERTFLSGLFCCATRPRGRSGDGGGSAAGRTV